MGEDLVLHEAGDGDNYGRVEDEDRVRILSHWPYRARLGVEVCPEEIDEADGTARRDEGAHACRSDGFQGEAACQEGEAYAGTPALNDKNDIDANGCGGDDGPLSAGGVRELDEPLVPVRQDPGEEEGHVLRVVAETQVKDLLFRREVEAHKECEGGEDDDPDDDRAVAWKGQPFATFPPAGAGNDSPQCVGEGEDEKHLKEPCGTGRRVLHEQDVFEIRVLRRERVPFQEVHHGGADKEREYGERYADANKTVLDERPCTLPVEGTGREIPRDEKETRKNPGSAHAHEDVEDEIGKRIMKILVKVPAVVGCVSQADMMEYHEECEGESQVVEIKHPLRSLWRHRPDGSGFLLSHVHIWGYSL